MRRSPLAVVTFVLCIGLLWSPPRVNAQKVEAGKIHVWVDRNFNSWDCPLHSELLINGQTVNIYTSDTFEPIEEYLKPGWNEITIKTTAQEPAEKSNALIFRIGPMAPDPRNERNVLMTPVLWEFRNDTDWKLNEGVYSHPLGPGVKEVTLAYRFYWAGLELEKSELKAGDFVLQGKPKYGGWNSPVVATVSVNGTPFNSFLLAGRQIVITSLLKLGKNEIKLVSARVKDSIKNNDVIFEVAGPAEWFVDKNQYVLAPVTQFKAMQGWSKEPRTGQLVNKLKPEADTIERTIPFILKQPPTDQ